MALETRCFGGLADDAILDRVTVVLVDHDQLVHATARREHVSRLHVKRRWGATC